MSPEQNTESAGPMRSPLVLIAPSYGARAVQQRWSDTMASEVPFTEERLLSLLDPNEVFNLKQHHPHGSARFWGALPSFDKRIDRMAAGDIILFTGESRLRALGVLAFKTRNPRLANALWPPEPGKSGWSNVYSVNDLEEIADVGYAELRRFMDASPRYPFQGADLLDAERSAKVLRRLGVAWQPVSEYERPSDVVALNALKQSSGIVAPEHNTVVETGYFRPGGRVVVRRAEALLVQSYLERLPDSRRLRVGTGVSDIYLPVESELIEAKSSSGHVHVRQALAQLLDYATNSTEEIEILSGLFPARPSGVSVRLLHHYGIDCVFFDEKVNKFVRSAAPDDRRAAILAVV